MHIPLGFGQVNFLFGGAGLPHGAQVTLGFEHTGSDLNATEAADAFADAWELDPLQRQVNDVTFIGTHVKYGPNVDGQEGDAVKNVTGIGTGDDASPNCALLVRKITQSGGRQNKGRMYIPGLNESTIDTGGVLDQSELDLWQAQLEDFYDNIISFGCTPMVLHAVLRGDQVPTPVEAFVADGTCATQRRRLRR